MGLSHRSNGLVVKKHASKKCQRFLQSGVSLSAGCVASGSQMAHGSHDAHAFFYLPGDHTLATQPFSFGRETKMWGAFVFAAAFDTAQCRDCKNHDEALSYSFLQMSRLPVV